MEIQVVCEVPGRSMEFNQAPAIFDHLEFKKSPIHGLGVIARRSFHKGDRILEYTGQKITKAESLRRCESNNEYIFALDDQFDLDGNVGWNPAKFINHSCAPNCDAEWVDGEIWILARRSIRAGEELTFNYGYDLDEYREHPCRCGAPECVGYIVAEEFFETVRERNRLEARDSNRTIGVQAVQGV